MGAWGAIVRAMKPDTPSTAGYAEQAPDLLVRYESYDPAQLLAWWIPLVPEASGTVLDVGAGTGRDAAWLAGQGYAVVAVEPVAALREGARALHPDPRITWVDDLLPELERVRAMGRRFGAILLSAVWMHLDEQERARGMAVLATLAEPAAVLAITLRHGPVPSGRRMFEVGEAETVRLAAACGFTHVPLDATERPEAEWGPPRGSVRADNYHEGVTWSKLAFRRTGTGRVADLARGG